MIKNSSQIKRRKSLDGRLIVSPITFDKVVGESYRELPFLESDFAVWMDQLEDQLLEMPHWRDLINYQGISLFDAAYFPLYWGFLDVFKKTYHPDYVCGGENKSRDKLASRSRAIYRRLRQGELSINEGTAIATSRLINLAEMQLPPQRMPKLPQQKRVLVLRAFPNRSAFPILPALKNRGATILFASWNDKLQKPVQELEIPYINIKRFYRRKYTQAFAAHTKAITEMLEHVDPALPSQLLGESSHYRLLWNAFQLFKESFTQTRVFIDLYLDLLDQYKPESIVLFNEISPPGRTMAKVAKIRKIPSIAIQHGLFIGHVYRALTTEKIIVWGELPRKFWLERGCEPEQVVSVGAIAHNHWPERPAYSPSGPKRIAPQRVLIIGQNPAAFISMSLHRTTIDTIMQSIGQMPGVKFTIKPHPGEDPTPYKTEIKKYRLNNVELVTHGGIEQFLLDADLVITLFSTVGAEAMFMGIPVIVVNLSDQPPIAPYASMCPIATDVHSLSSYIKKILSDPIYRERLVENGEKFAHDYFGSTDSQAAGRAADLIMKSLSSINRK